MPDKDKISDIACYEYCCVGRDGEPSQEAKITQLLLEERIDEIRNFAGYEDDDWNGIAQIPQQRFIERIAELEAALKENKSGS